MHLTELIWTRVRFSPQTNIVFQKDPSLPADALVASVKLLGSNVPRITPEEVLTNNNGAITIQPVRIVSLSPLFLILFVLGLLLLHSVVRSDSARNDNNFCFFLASSSDQSRVSMRSRGWRSVKTQNVDCSLLYVHELRLIAYK